MIPLRVGICFRQSCCNPSRSTTPNCLHALASDPRQQSLPHMASASREMIRSSDDADNGIEVLPVLGLSLTVTVILALPFHAATFPLSLSLSEYDCPLTLVCAHQGGPQHGRVPRLFPWRHRRWYWHRQNDRRGWPQDI